MNESQLGDYKDRITEVLTGITDYLGHYYVLHDPAELEECVGRQEPKTVKKSKT